jgi:phosphoserine phosphatase
MFVATLVAADALTAQRVADARSILHDAGCEPEAPQWIDEGCAADIRFSGDRAAARQALDAWGAAVDHIVQPVAARAKSLLIADMDSTMITVECIDELADYAGIKPQIAAITERAMRGELDFAAALTERVALLAGLPETVIEQCLAERVSLMPGARTLVGTMRARGTRCVLVSGGFTRFAQPVADQLGFDVAIANQLGVTDGVLTGRVIPPIIDSGTKRATLDAECAAIGITRDAVLAVGDGANDIPMIEAAGLGVAYHGHPRAVTAADAAIRYGDHRVLLWAQGIARAQWVSG